MKAIRTLTLAAGMILASTTTADAGWFRGRAAVRVKIPLPTAAAPAIKATVCAACEAANVAVTITATASLAQQRADQQAAEGRLRHVGPVPPGMKEGVGFSTVSADHAIRSCCFWGRYPAHEIGVARGLRGWFATVLYR